MSSLNKALKYINYQFTSKSAHGIHSPFVFKFIQELIETKGQNYYQFDELNKVREELLKNDSIIEITDFGAGSKVFTSNKRKISDIAKHGISKRKFSELYFKLVNFCEAKHIVELGTSLGLNTLYLAQANSKSTVYTIEGCPQLSKFSQELFKKNKTENIKTYNDTFEKALPEILNEIPQLDIFYVDGNHQYQATLNYFKLALQKKHEQSVFIFDDINWNKEMQKAWEEIKNDPEVTLSIDLFFVGIIFFRKEQKQKEHFILKF